MTVDRSLVCRSAAEKLAGAKVTKVRAVLGFDGFVDAIIEVVDKRHSAGSYDRVKTISEFGQKVLAAAGLSANYEFVVTLRKLGGNGPIMANAMAAAGFPVTYVGNLGYPSIDPVFADMAQRAEVISIADPGQTDAVEFTDGKLMLGKIASLAEVSWDNLLARVGKEKLVGMLAQADLIGLVNWTMLPHMTNIWEHLLTEVLPMLPAKAGGGRRRVFIDLADPEKRTVEDLQQALKTLARFQPFVDVTLGLNLKESDQVARALGLTLPEDSERVIEKTAGAIRAKLGIDTVVIHPRKGAAAADQTGSASFVGPFVKEPKIATGAGDHFNAGFVTGQLLGLNLAEALAAGCGTSGYYVRNAVSPSISQLAEFVRELPPGE